MERSLHSHPGRRGSGSSGWEHPQEPGGRHGPDTPTSCPALRTRLTDQQGMGSKAPAGALSHSSKHQAQEGLWGLRPAVRPGGRQGCRHPQGPVLTLGGCYRMSRCIHRARRAAPEENPHAGHPSCEQTQMPAVTVYTGQARAECVSRDPDAPEANCTSQPPDVPGKGRWDVSTSLLGQRTLFFGIWT